MFWIVAAVLSVLVAAYGLSYLPRGAAAAPPGVDHNAAGMTTLIVHASAAGLALLLGPFQFIGSIRRRAPLVHRWIGRVYVLACIVGGLFGAALALGTTAGLLAVTGFFTLAVLWLATTAMAWRFALKRDFRAHKRWMIRSFALTFAAVMLRVYLPLSMVAGISGAIAYPIIAWLCWAPNFLLVEAWFLMTAPRAALARPATQ